MITYFSFTGNRDRMLISRIDRHTLEVIGYERGHLVQNMDVHHNNTNHLDPIKGPYLHKGMNTTIIGFEGQTIKSFDIRQNSLYIHLQL